MVRETRHLWVGNLPENVREEKIIEHFKRYGRVESVKVLPKRGSEGGVAAFVDFVDIKSAQKAHNAINKMGDRDLRTDYNEPGTIPSAARGLDDSLSLGSRSRDVSGFTRAAGGAVYGPPTSLHSRDGRYERRLDGTTESRDRPYDHSTYGHHERPGSSFERQRHYETDYYREARERTLSTAGSVSGTSSGSGTSVSPGVSGTIVSAVTANTGTVGSAVATTVGSGGSTSSVVGFYRSHSGSPCRFETPEPRYESRAREPFTLASVVHRDLYREDRGRRGERSYRHSRSRSPHSTHSRNPSPQRLASQATRPARSHSGSGSHSRSSSSDSVSSTSSSTSGSDSSSSSSDESPARSVQSAAVPAPSALPLSSLDKDEPRKSFGIKVQNLPVRSTDTSLKDGLFHEFKKHGKVTSVQIHGASEERYGLVFFRQQEDQEKALGASKGKLFFGMQIEVTAWNGPETESENEFRPLDERIDEFHPKATRTLFIGNLEKTTSYHDLLNIFQRFGEIVDIDIKKVNGAPQYAFLQYCDIASVCKAIKKMDGEYLGNNRLKLGFGKSMPTTCVWLDGLASNTTEQFLTRHFCRYGHVVKVVFDRMKGMALILYNNIEYAQAAVKDTKGWKIGGSKIKVDFANQESQMAFYRSMQASGQDIRDFYDLLTERRDDRRTQYEFQAERQYFENVRTPGTYTEDPRRKYPARSREFFTEWDPYQGDYFDPQYFEDPREYREYRADPYEQDIRKYSYLQRERERERERFETDRGRGHGRRTVERSQSPSHIASRRPASPAASPSLSERIPSDSDRRICCQSSERSGSCSSISPPRFEKLEKARTERYTKTDKLEKDRVFEVERGNLVEKEKRAGRKDRGDKDKSDKQRLKKLKVASPSIQASETEPELERDVGPESVVRDKPATRKSERIDREKLKRASSPRGEVPKPSFESRVTSKSPIHASDSEQNLESSLIHGRTRRRNVKSVYATLHEEEQACKDVLESSRSMRKRVADKEPIQQEVPIPTTTARRGRPPKKGFKRGGDVSPIKGDQQKMIEDDTEVKETSTNVEGWRSPRTQKVQQIQLTSSAPVNKKGGKIDKQSGSTTVLAGQADLASQDESELNPKADSELFVKLSENSSSPVDGNEKDLKDPVGNISIDGDIQKEETSSSDRRQQPEKSVKMKTARLKRNAKQVAEEKSHSLKNLEIRVSVDDVKGLLRSEDDEPESFEAPTIIKTKTVVKQNEETKSTGFPKESKEFDAQEQEDNLSEPELPADPATLLAQQMELEQAVENIAKLSVEQPPRPYKEPPSQQPTILPPVVVEPEVEVEEEKRANPASETELAAAIDSITAEETLADADHFAAPPPYTALIPTPESLTSPSSNEIMEPETHMVINSILAADSDDGPLTPSPKGLIAESKAADDVPLLETPKKTGRVRPKTPKKSRGRKGAAYKKGDNALEVPKLEPSPVKLPESIPEDPETINSKAVTVTAGATAASSVVTAVATCRRAVTSAITVDTPKEAEQPEVEQPVPKESAFHSGKSNTPGSKKNPKVEELPTPTLAPARPQPVSHGNSFSTSIDCTWNPFNKSPIAS
ncbi:hypothetical protein PBY51_000274 [Eleginops maclovinus]|uniref:RRM domain-containing protein n=1 Tax=Eleginops maclovinus TaxID=56733 RepID=A0AAN8AQA1_ELEMC|nr:hypothetical protein PBY51_000274 [Eleginops maclovinus]